MDVDLGTLLVIAAVAVLAPVLAAIPKRLRVAVVVIEIGLGIVVGPDVLDLAQTDPTIDVLAAMGLAALFFLAGAEVDPPAIRGGPLNLASLGWGASVGIALLAAWALDAGGVAENPEFVALALATTALGVLVPVLRDSGLRGTPFGTMVLAAGTAGEMGPIILMSIFLAVGESTLTQVLLLAVFAASTLALAVTAPRLRSPWIARLLRETMHATGQLAVRICLLLLVALVFLATELGLELTLGAFAAGVVLGIVMRDTAGSEVLAVKLDAVAFGLLVPIFFVHSGLTFDLDGLLASSGALLQLPIFLVLFLVVRGTPAVLAARRLDRRGVVSLGFLSAATLPLVVAVTQAGVREDRLASDTAAALVGAAMLSVLIYPAVALALLGRTAKRGPDPQPEAL
ncbi:MAG: cation:proton antiporter [Thermoleophilia bacterium]